MFRTKNGIIFPILLGLFVVSYSDLGEPILPQVTNGDFTLYVSNQSFALDPVDVKIYVDGKVAVKQNFYVDGQHNWIEFHFQLGAGSHTIRAVSKYGESDQQGSFVLPDNPYCVVNFWWYPVMTGGTGPTPKKFTISFFPSPPGFL